MEFQARQGGMRIIAGQWRSRVIAAPPTASTRPTADRTRETLFSMLASRLGSFEDLAVADLFAGSGALALRSAVARRGAGDAGRNRRSRAQDHPRQCRDARRRGQAAGLLGAQASSRRQPFDLIFADPPYAAGSGDAVRAAVEQAGWLAPGGWLAIETAKGEAVDPGTLRLDAERDTGPARLTLLQG